MKCSKALGQSISQIHPSLGELQASKQVLEVRRREQGAGNGRKVRVATGTGRYLYGKLRRKAVGWDPSGTTPSRYKASNEH